MEIGEIRDPEMWPVIGQDRVVRLLARSLEEGRLPHACLLMGPRHVGKMTLAISLAQALNCSSGERPCGECSSCRRIFSGHHPDVQIIELAGVADGETASRKTIGVDQIREMQRSVSLNPYEGKYRVIIIDGAENMSEGAANSLLKTLEEPPPGTVFILISVDGNLLLPTIHSRCQRFELEPVPVHRLEEVLRERYGLTPERARLLARFSHGGIGWAISAISDENLLEERSLNLERLIPLAGYDISQRFEVASSLGTEFGGNRMAVREQMGLWLTWWRDLLLMKGDCTEEVVNLDREADLRRQAACCDLGGIAMAVRAIQTAMGNLQRNANPRLALEVMMLDIPRLEEGESHA